MTDKPIPPKDQAVPQREGPLQAVRQLFPPPPSQEDVQQVMERLRERLLGAHPRGENTGS